MRIMSSPTPPPPRQRRINTRTLIFCGTFAVFSCWSFALFSLLSSFPSPPEPPSALHDAPSSNQNQPLSSGAVVGSSSSSNNNNDSNNNGIDDGETVKTNDRHRHLRSTEEPAHHLNQSAPVTSFTYPLHAKSGTHHAYLYIGTPPQRQTLIVDTGSRLTAFPCQPHCPKCGKHASKPFLLNASTSHEIVSCDKCRLNEVDFPIEEYFLGGGLGSPSGDEPGLRGAAEKRALFPNSCVNARCGLDQKYTEGSSWKAFEVQDKVWMGLDSADVSLDEHNKYGAPFTFGCQTIETGLFTSQYADGIMGLAMYTHTLMGTWLKHGTLSHTSFSLCMNQKGGHISLGGTGLTYDPPSEQKLPTNAPRHLAPMMYTPFAKDHVWYYVVRVTSISVGKYVVPERFLEFVNDHKGTIVDSGTTDTFISHKVAAPIISYWKKITGRKYNNRSQQYTYEQFTQLPIITFELDGGIKWEINPESYMEPVDSIHLGEGPSRQWDGKRGFISRVYVDEPQGVVLGSNAMMDKEIHFDVANRRLGVAKATCVY